MVSIYDRDAKLIVDVIALLADLMEAPPGVQQVSDIYTALMNWTPSDEEPPLPKVGAGVPTQTLPAYRLRAIAVALTDQLS